MMHDVHFIISTAYHYVYYNMYTCISNLQYIRIMIIKSLSLDGNYPWASTAIWALTKVRIRPEKGDLEVFFSVKEKGVEPRITPAFVSGAGDQQITLGQSVSSSPRSHPPAASLIESPNHTDQKRSIRRIGRRMREKAIYRT